MQVEFKDGQFVVTMSPDEAKLITAETVVLIETTRVVADYTPRGLKGLARCLAVVGQAAAERGDIPA